MTGNDRILALIPARGGSKGIKDKNIRDLKGKPLIAYTIEAALQSRYIDDTVVTTDSRRIAEVAVRFGAEVPFMRPAELAADETPTIDAVLHAVETLKEMGRTYDTLVLLQPTQPLRTAEDIDAAVEAFCRNGKKALLSVSEVEDPPLLIRSVRADGSLEKLLPENSTCRRQDMPDYYRVNGCIYINAVCELDRNTGFNDNPMPYFMEKSHSVDIDERKDIAAAEYYLGQGMK